MSFIYDNGVVFEQVGIALGLGQQDAVGHDLDAGLGRGLVAEADFAADIAAVGHLEFFGHALSNGKSGHAARLRDGNAAGLAPASL